MPIIALNSMFLDRSFLVFSVKLLLYLYTYIHSKQEILNYYKYHLRVIIL